MTPPDGDTATAWLRDFDVAVTPQAKRRLERDPDISQLVIRAIEAGWSVDALAANISYGIGWQQPANARALMVWRLRRAAGVEDVI